MKRKACIASAWLILALAAVAIVRYLPAVYVAESVILVDSQKIPEKFVSATVASDLQDRIETIKQQILSTGRLQKIIDDFGLYREQRKTHFQEEILDMMRKDITIELIQSKTGGRDKGPGAFRVGYQGPDPYIVAQVANRLTSLYVEENLKTREVQAEGTSEFLDTQLQESKRRLDELEAAVSSYKLKHNGELPQQESSLASTLSRLQVELEANRDAINRVQQTKIILENSLSAAEASLAAQLKATEAASAPGAREVPPLDPQSGQPAPRKKSAMLEEELALLRTRYRDNHPDVVRLRASIESMKRTEEEEAAAASPAAEPKGDKPSVAAWPRREPADVNRTREQVAGLKAQIKAADKELEDRQAEQRRVLRDLNVYQSRMERLPVREQEMAQLTRDYEISKDNYKSLLDKKIAAGIALDMERRQKSERFTVIDPARVPEKPVKPNRPLLYAIGGVASLVLALLAGFGAERRQNVVLGEWELPRDTIVLARLPYIEIPAAAADATEQGGRTGHRKRKLALVTSALLSVLSAIAAGAYFVMQRL